MKRPSASVWAVTNGIGTQMTDTKLDVSNVPVNDAHVFQKRMADTPDGPQAGSVAGQIKRDFGYYNVKSVSELVND